MPEVCNGEHESDVLARSRQQGSAPPLTFVPRVLFDFRGGRLAEHNVRLGDEGVRRSPGTVARHPPYAGSSCRRP